MPKEMDRLGGTTERLKSGRASLFRPNYSDAEWSAFSKGWTYGFMAGTVALFLFLFALMVIPRLAQGVTKCFSESPGITCQLRSNEESLS